MAHGKNILALAQKHIGEKYENVLVPKNNPNWKGPWDCAEFASWLVFQDAQILYGCYPDSGNPAVADAYTGKWKEDALKLGQLVTVDQAAAIPGAFVLRYPPSAGAMGHIVVSDGKGGTVEAMGHKYGVKAGSLQNRNWNTGVLIPGIFYDQAAAAIPVKSPPKFFALGHADMKVSEVKQIQKALAKAGFDPGVIDGIYGPHTVAAVAAYQKVQGLVVDGQMGPQTAGELGIKL